MHVTHSAHWFPEFVSGDAVKLDSVLSIAPKIISISLKNNFSVFSSLLYHVFYLKLSHMTFQVIALLKFNLSCTLAYLFESP